MLNRLAGRVAIVTGAGRGLGRSHALRLAAEGAAVVVNDLGGDVHGDGADLTPAQQVADEIRAAGGTAIVSGHDVADWTAAGDLVAFAMRELGDLHVLVNNAGILRDRTLANMAEEEWDSVVRVHLKGHAAMSHHAAAHWRRQVKAGRRVSASVIHTSSASGLIGNFGQANYGAAKAGVVGLSHVMALELGGIGVRSNVISPAAATRMGQPTPVAHGAEPQPAGDELHQQFDPDRVSPLVAWLAAPDCPSQDQLFHVYGNRVTVLALTVAADLKSDSTWTLAQLDHELTPRLARALTIADVLTVPG